MHLLCLLCPEFLCVLSVALWYLHQSFPLLYGPISLPCWLYLTCSFRRTSFTVTEALLQMVLSFLVNFLSFCCNILPTVQICFLIQNNLIHFPSLTKAPCAWWLWFMQFGAWQQTQPEFLLSSTDKRLIPTVAFSSLGTHFCSFLIQLYQLSFFHCAILKIIFLLKVSEFNPLPLDQRQHIIAWWWPYSSRSS
jgi:hypothetical protein